MDGRQISSQRGDCGALGYVRDVRCHVRLKIGRGLDDILRPNHPTDAPSGHRVCLGNTVQNDCAIRERRDDHWQARRGSAVVKQVLIDFIGDDPQAVLERPLADRLYLLGRINRTSWVRGGAEQQDLGLWGAGCFELFDGDQIVLGFIGEYFDGYSTSKLDALGICSPIWRRQQNFIARINNGSEGFVDGLLSAIGN